MTDIDVAPIKDAARRLGVSESALRQRIAAGRLAAHRLPGDPGHPEILAVSLAEAAAAGIRPCRRRPRL